MKIEIEYSIKRLIYYIESVETIDELEKLKLSFNNILRCINKVSVSDFDKLLYTHITADLSTMLLSKTQLIANKRVKQILKEK